jgi:hypothetical protein
MSKKNTTYLVHSTQHAMTLSSIAHTLDVRAANGVKVFAVGGTLQSAHASDIVVHHTRAVDEYRAVVGGDGALVPLPVLQAVFGGHERKEEEGERDEELHGC